ncbi:transcriptional regulator [Azohydromonas caseinilytica]|uniref:Transcriptional regulator n=1 Tax=Azohydromonas caseinilytica TaxID=2728836 RepID=A0A848FJP5_9BURK|nr:transcriptional regulator [Azohydromonas caseinilytica]NML18031.1 transcriptional regulator [Azohydromonas caseinilytica]
MDVESGDGSVPALRIRLLGALAVHRGGAPVALPPSRKVRALLAYLALAARPVARSHLCELLWDLPNDPRGELRWCLSKARAVLDSAGRARVVADADTVRLDLAGAQVDALQVQAAVQSGLAMLEPAHLHALAARFEGEFLQDLDIERSAPWSAWLLGQRRQFRAARVAILEHLAHALAPGSDAALASLEQWLRLAPFDRRAHEALLDALARRGRLREGDEHLAATARMFEAEGQDWTPLGRAWRAAKERQAAPVLVIASAAEPVAAAPPRRASIAVMPFSDHAPGVAARGGLADGLAYDVITRLAKLRSLFVIAPGTVFALDRQHLGAGEAGRALDVDYTVSGHLRRQGSRVTVAVQLAETRSARVVWADLLTSRLDEALRVLDEIGDRIVASVAGQIEVAERNRAILKAPDSLDAWEAHHRGLWHAYRFDRAHNEQARHFFETAVRLDPGFARPWAGLSFTHFQNAFLGWGPRDTEVELAYRTAAQALLADDRDPAAHWALGRALWLRGQLDESLVALDASTELSPNFALGHYTQAFVHAQSGDPQAAIRAADLSRRLSPFDPLLFGMLASRALALMRLGRHDEAADSALQAAARPNAHVHILAIAAHCLALAGRQDKARAVAASIQQRVPGYGIGDLLAAFRLADDMAALLRTASGALGLEPSGPAQIPQPISGVVPPSRTGQ